MDALPTVELTYAFLVNPDAVRPSEPFFKPQTLTWEVLTLHLNTGKMRCRTVWLNEKVVAEFPIQPFFEKYQIRE